MKALSIRQPWAHLITNGTKRIENRTWWTHFRGEFLIHASKAMTGREYFDAAQFAAHREIAIDLPPAKALDRGGIVGIAYLKAVIRPGDQDYAACRADHPAIDLRWHIEEQFGFVLADVRPIPFIPCAGMLGFFTPGNAIVNAALRALDAAAPSSGPEILVEVGP